MGVALRLYRVEAQLLTGDELHSLRAALQMPVASLLRTWTFYGADYCVPLTALFRALMDRGAVLSELTLRAPVLIASVGTLVVVPGLLVQRLGRDAAWLLAWLLAFSPLLVLYGRIVRSYAPLVLLVFGAVMAFERWWRTRSLGAAAAYAGLSALAVWLHLVALPLVFAPFVYAGVATLVRADDRGRRTAGLAGLLAATLLAVAVPLAPARESLQALRAAQGGGQWPALAVFEEVARLQLGTASRPFAALLTLALARGAWILWQRERGFLLLLVTLGASQLVGLAVLAPNKLESLHVVSRYLLPLLPFTLALVALGLAAPWTPSPSRRARALQMAAVSVVLAGAVITGPLVGPVYRESAFAHANENLTFTRPGNRMAPADVPAFYRQLGAAGTPGALLEYPWVNLGTHALDAYQRLHRQDVRGVPLNAELLDPRLALRNSVAPEPEALLAAPARWLVVHRDLAEEEERVESSDPYQAERLVTLPQLWQASRLGARRLSRRLRDAWGAPDVDEEAIEVWDLDRIRRADTPDPAGP